MALFKSTILQIGDVHFPEWRAAASDVDLKVSEFSPRIVSEMQTDALTTVLGGLRDLCRTDPIDAAILMGDLTSHGRIECLKNAVLVLAGLINDTDRASPVRVFGVPGNHDVSREDAVNLGDVGKFKPLQDAFASVDWPMPPIQRYIRESIAHADGEVPLYLINSSIGSWSKSLFPDGLRELVFSGDTTPVKVTDAAPFGDARIGSDRSGTLLEQVYEQLDTPYFRAADIQAIAEEIERSDDIAIVVAHHNILPQYLPRVSYFGEVLNAGFARQLLLATDTNVVFLHGHIHTDPIEIVSTPDGQGMIVSIAAPVIWRGFNVVTLFRNAEGATFAVKIAQHRSGATGLTVRSRLVPLTVDRADLMRKGAHRLWNYLRNESGNPLQTFNASEIALCGSKVGLKGDELEATLLALFCAKLIDIRNFGGPTNSWRITIRG